MAVPNECIALSLFDAVIARCVLGARKPVEWWPVYNKRKIYFSPDDYPILTSACESAAWRGLLRERMLKRGISPRNRGSPLQLTPERENSPSHSIQSAWLVRVLHLHLTPNSNTGVYRSNIPLTMGWPKEKHSSCLHYLGLWLRKDFYVIPPFFSSAVSHREKEWALLPLRLDCGPTSTALMAAAWMVNAKGRKQQLEVLVPNAE